MLRARPALTSCVHGVAAVVLGQNAMIDATMAPLRELLIVKKVSEPLLSLEGFDRPVRVASYRIGDVDDRVLE